MYQPLSKKRIAQSRSGGSSGLKNSYQKLDKQHQRQKKWRALNFLFRSAMGWVWLTVFLAIVVAVSLGAWSVWGDTLGPKLQELFNWK